MLSTEPPDSRNIRLNNTVQTEIKNQIPTINTTNDETLLQKCDVEFTVNMNPTPASTTANMTYLDKLRAKVFEEIIERIEKNMDADSASILDTARSKLANIKDDAILVSLLLKPVFLIFLVEVYLEAQVNI